MNNTIYLICILLGVAASVQAQVAPIATDCATVNARLKDAASAASVLPLVWEMAEGQALYLKPEYHDSLPAIIRRLHDVDATFEAVLETRSRLDSTRFFRRYQQYYKGLKVTGGGYTTAYTAPGGPTDPCATAYLLAPYIHTGVAVDTQASVPASALAAILHADTVGASELLITHHLLSDCAYQLCWEVSYTDSNGIAQIAWIDAQQGKVLKTVSAGMSINAPTPTYGIVPLNDRSVNGVTTLETPDQRIRVYDFEILCPLEFNAAEWNEQLLPSTTAGEWTVEVFEPTYQAFYIATKIVPAFDQIGLHFDQVNIGTCLDPFAGTFREASMTNAFIVIGQDDGRPLGLVDIMSHELAHIFVYKFLEYTLAGNGSLHEGISDMIGKYVEYKLNNGLNWEMAWEEPTVATNFNRNLASPGQNGDCFTDVVNLTISETHQRSKPLGHWFYLITDGDAAAQVSALGIEKSISIVMDALNLLPPQSDYPDMMLATLQVCKTRFGRCSEEYLSVARAWEKICVPTGLANSQGQVPSCNFTLCGPDQVCEESNALSICICEYLPQISFRWLINGSLSTGFQSAWGMQGNTQTGGICLDLTQFPTFPYYPQYIDIEVYAPAIGRSQTQLKRVKIVDCDGDDPTCKEYHAFQGSPSDDRKAPSTALLPVPTETEASMVRIFDLSGRLHYEGPPEQDWQQLSLPRMQWLVIVLFDAEGRNMDIRKIFLPAP